MTRNNFFHRNNHLHRLIAVGLLVVFGIYYSNVTLFYHTHIINGVTIVHSHSHTSHHHDSNDGGHSEIQITLCAQLSNQLLTTAAKAVSSVLVANQQTTRIGEHAVDRVVSSSVAGFSLRAPPVLA